MTDEKAAANKTPDQWLQEFLEEARNGILSRDSLRGFRLANLARPDLAANLASIEVPKELTLGDAVAQTYYTFMPNGESVKRFTGGSLCMEVMGVMLVFKR